MIAGPALLAALGLLLQGVQAAPSAQPEFASLDAGLVSILEDVHSRSPIVWQEVTNSDGSKSNITDIDNAAWDAAVDKLARRDAAVGKRQSNKHCHGSGSWAKQLVLKNGVPDACGQLKNTPIGQTRIWTRPGFNSVGDPMTIYYSKQSNGQGDSLGIYCVMTINWIIDNCAGNNQDTRGGYATGIEQSRYGVDPQTHNCNC